MSDKEVKIIQYLRKKRTATAVDVARDVFHCSPSSDSFFSVAESVKSLQTDGKIKRIGLSGTYAVWRLTHDVSES